MKPITKRMRINFKAAFGAFETMKKSERNKQILTQEQVKLIKETRAQGITPKQLEELTGMSVYRIHQIVNIKELKPRQNNMNNQQQDQQTADHDIQVQSQQSQQSHQTVQIVPGMPLAALPPPIYTPKPIKVKPTNFIDRPIEDPLTIVIAAARGHAVLFDQIQKKKQKQLRKQIPAGRPLEYYCEKYKNMKEKIDNEYNSNGKFPPEDFMLRHLMLAKLISDMECPTKPKRNKEKYKPKALARAEAQIQAQQQLLQHIVQTNPDVLQQVQVTPTQLPPQSPNAEQMAQWIQ
jgi:hypothetical protein